jgi:hypothetical protein
VGSLGASAPGCLRRDHVILRRRFADVIRTQIELFRTEEAELIRDCERAEEAYNRAGRDEAEERYGDYLDLVETGTEILAGLRDRYAATLDTETKERYVAEFNRTVAKRLPRFALELEDS